MDRAVQVHNDQAGLFGERYRTLPKDPYRSAFHYGRHRVGEHIAHLLGPGDGRLLLDAGCGTGFWVSQLAAHGFVVHGMDAASEMVERARQSAESEAALAIGDVRALPYGDSSFDVITSIEVIRYIPEAQQMLQEALRVLKPGGIAVITAAPRFSLHGYGFLNRLLARSRTGRFTRLTQYFHTTRTLRRALEQAGFKRVSVRGVFLGPFVWLDRLSPQLSRTLLRAWAPADDLVAGRPGTANICNHIIAVGYR